MLRQVSNRNQRGKGGGGLKMKNALQACLVIAICIWLIYQMTHSHGEKKIFEEGNSKALFKGGERQTDAKKFSRKDLSQMNKVEAIREIQSGDEEEIKGANKLGQRIRDEEVEDEGEESSGESREEEKEEAEAEAEHDELDENDHDEEAHKGGENEEASQAARERSFKADDASSAVAHVPHSNGQETESENEAIWKNLDENDSDDKKMHRGKQELESENEAAKIFKRKEGEARDILKEKQENAGGDNSSVVHQGISILQNKTTFESENEGQQPEPGIRVSSTMNNQTAAYESPINLNHEIHFQKNSTAVSVEQSESPTNLTVKMDPNNVTISQYQTTVVHEQINTTKTLSQEGEVPNLKTERAMMGQKDSKTSSATNEIRKAVRLEADDSLGSQEKNRDVNIDALRSSLDIQSKAQSGKPEAMAA